MTPKKTHWGKGEKVNFTCQGKQDVDGLMNGEGEETDSHTVPLIAPRTMLTVTSVHFAEMRKTPIRLSTGKPCDYRQEIAALSMGEG